MQNYEAFRAEVCARLSAKKRPNGRRWTYDDVAAATGYSRNTIEQFMCGLKITDNVATAMAKALDIPEHMAT